MKKILYILLIFSSFVVNAQNNTKPVYKEKKYSNGNLMYKGYFLNGVPTGEFLRYYPNGKLKAKMNYSSAFVMASLYNEKGLILAKGRYVNKQKDSIWLFYKNNKIVGEEEYRNGVLNGKVKKFFPNGKLADIKEYKNGRKDGQWKRFYREGKIMCSCKYKNGKLDGGFSAYTPMGVRDIKGNFKDNLREGVWEYYDKKGKLRFSIEYEAGMPKDNDQLDKMNKEDMLLYKRSEQHFIDPQKYINSPEEYIIKSRKTGNN